MQLIVNLQKKLLDSNSSILEHSKYMHAVHALIHVPKCKYIPHNNSLLWNI